MSVTLHTAIIVPFLCNNAISKAKYAFKNKDLNYKKFHSKFSSMYTGQASLQLDYCSIQNHLSYEKMKNMYRYIFDLEYGCFPIRHSEKMISMRVDISCDFSKGISLTTKEQILKTIAQDCYSLFQYILKEEKQDNIPFVFYTENPIYIKDNSFVLNNIFLSKNVLQSYRDLHRDFKTEPFEIIVPIEKNNCIYKILIDSVANHKEYTCRCHFFPDQTEIKLLLKKFKLKHIEQIVECFNSKNGKVEKIKLYELV